MKVINCSKKTHCINFMQFQRYKQMYEDSEKKYKELEKKYNKLLSNMATYDSENEKYLAENYSDEDWNDEL